MKNCLLLIGFLIFSGKLLSQEFKIPNIEFKNKTEGLNTYINLLKINDEQALIIKIGSSSYWSKGLYSDFLVFENDGNVSFYECFFPLDTNKKQKIKKKRIRKSKRKFYWNFLSNSYKNNRFSIVKSMLNITSKSNGDGTSTMISVSDGANYSPEITQGNKYSAFSTYSPNTFIEKKFPGWKERKKLVELTKDIYDLIKKY